MSDVDRAVWETVRHGDRKGTVVTPEVVAARTGVHLTASDLADVVARLTAAGRLYWRNPRVRRRLLAAPWPQDPPPADCVQPALWETTP